MAKPVHTNSANAVVPEPFNSILPGPSKWRKPHTQTVRCAEATVKAKPKQKVIREISLHRIQRSK